MDHELTGTPEAASEPTPPLSVGGLFIEALARRDFTALADCLQPGVRLRALLPDGPAELTGCEEVAGWFRSLFGGPEELELADATVGEIGPRLYMRWRVSHTAPGPSGPRHLVEQHVFAASGERISALDLLCSEFVTTEHTHISAREDAMAGKAVISLTTGLEDPEKVTVAFLVALGAAESGRPTLMFLAKEAVRLAVNGVAQGVACAGCPPIPELFERYERAGGRYLVCPICVDAKQIDKGDILPNAEIGGTVVMWKWIGTDAATTFSY